MPSKSGKNTAKNKQPFLIGEEKLRHLYITMLRCRELDRYARGFGQRFPWSGKEAVLAAGTSDLKAEDHIVFIGDHAVAKLLRGTPLKYVVRDLKANAFVQRTKRPPLTDAQVPLATGVAHRLFEAKPMHVTVAFLCEPADSTPAGREAMLFAAHHQLPLIYIYRAESVDAAQMQAHGFPVIPVDGSDVVAVYRVAHECIVRARKGGGPSAIACSFAMQGKSHDPVRNMERYLLAKGLFKTGQRERILETIDRSTQNASRGEGVTLRKRSTAAKAPNLFIL